MTKKEFVEQLDKYDDDILIMVVDNSKCKEPLIDLIRYTSYSEDLKQEKDEYSILIFGVN